MSDLKVLAGKLGFRAIESNWSEYADAAWLQPLLEAELKERDRRNLDARQREAKIGTFRPMAEFDWDWPKRIDRIQVEELFLLDFIGEKSNVALVGNEGLGKTMIGQNLAYTAVMRGYHTLFFKASKMLNDLMECDGARSRKSLLKRLCKADLLVIDEIGYMSYDNRYADLLYEVIAERYSHDSTVITTNRVFTQWGEIFPTAACVVTLVDKLVHKSEIVVIEGDSYRLHEAEQREEEKAKARKAKSSKRKQNPTSKP